ncbi:MAG: site-2 protease family protein [Deltaproteobacteria bacterium]|nr:site-2 protease family protein [Deltaproteobacteria bacterium]
MSPTFEPEPVEEPPAPHPGASVRVHVGLFLATLLSLFVTGAMQVYPAGEPMSLAGLIVHLPSGWTFAVPMMAILLCHEFGHYFAARWHRVPASLPYFIPLPLLSPFGTMGAVISMPERIRSRNALLDIGAAGPLAGLVVAIPVLAVGLAHSPVVVPDGGWVEGQSLLYLALKRAILGAISPGHDVLLTPTAFAGWAGLFVTVLNLLPIGQLDGGHVGYALFGPRQNLVAKVLHRALPAVFLYNLATFRSVEPGMVWLVWFVLLAVMARATGGNHPPTESEDEELSPARRFIGLLCLALFVLLFMPTPMRNAG